MDNKNLRMRLMLEAEKEIVSGLNEAERYRYFLGRMQFLRYESGKENMISSDCSGSVCLALLLATGCSIRVTADTCSKNILQKRILKRMIFRLHSSSPFMTESLETDFIEKMKSAMWPEFVELMLYLIAWSLIRF